MRTHPSARAVGTSPPPGEAAGPGDLGRRVAAARRRLGLSREETAARAGMVPAYLAYLEEQSASPAPETVSRLADALGIGVDALYGGGFGIPPGSGHTQRRPRLLGLGPEECRTLLSTHGVGRVTLSTPDGRPAVVPVNYDVVDGAIVFRTAPDSVTALTVDEEVAFEVDHVDEALGEGWSVLAVGHANVVTGPDAVRGLVERAHTTPWAGDDRAMWVSMRPRSLTGRRITAVDRKPPG
ncbi:pyridoxamine 5'-phosphate oxidase family protein [Streptomyces sp. NPDC048663]|uniref:helix-turn-helix domain-containing protein n=1 Tax=Streptomyces sp. NPDC048663 TaxID=3155638 RepID=UPI00342F283A